MGGIDPGSWAGQIITYMGGGAGAKIAVAGAICAWLLTAIKAWHEKAAWITTLSAGGAWIAAWLLKLFGLNA